ncbi:MAG: sigma-54 dependent transcriptional regulator [Elusimicrobiota bacterium]
MNNIILIVEDEKGVIESYREIFRDKYKLLVAMNAEEALDIISKEEIDLVIMDIRLPGMDGIEALKKIKEIDETIEVIMVTAVQTIKTAIEAMKSGAYDYITKPVDLDEFTATVNKALQKRALVKELTYLKSEIKPVGFDNIIGQSTVMKKIYSFIEEMEKTDATIMIIGESGTGKELIARAIHFNSKRKENPFVAVDCASIPENLLESELFGFEKGAFTDARTAKPGKFELANGGTLFLDEIGNMHIEMQGKILRAIETREIQRLGSIRTMKIDIRIISATNIDLKKAVEEKKFRQDLYYRLNVVPVNVPPLRERENDVELLFRYYLDLYNKKFKKNIKAITEDAMAALRSYEWPGNVRELRNVVERVVALSKGDVISPPSLPIDIFFVNESTPEPSGKIPIKPARHKFEKQFIIEVMEKCNWNQSEAARILNIHRNTLIYKMKQLGLNSYYKAKHVPEVKP